MRIETGPHKHSIGQTFFLYCFEPGGNRFEIGAGGYMIFDPDWKPVVWTQAERSQGQAWVSPDDGRISLVRNAACADAGRPDEATAQVKCTPFFPN